MRYEKSFKNKQEEIWKAQRIGVPKFVNNKKAAHLTWKDDTKILGYNDGYS